MGKSETLHALPGTVSKGRNLGWFLALHHEWDSFLPRCNWRDFTLIKIGGEWSQMTERVEIGLCLLGVWLTITYVYGDAFTNRLQGMRDDCPAVRDV